jgi:hypothetical protein
MKRYLLYCLTLLLAACGSSDEKAKEQPILPQGPLAKSANSDTFNLSFGKLMTDYYALKEGFVTEKDSAIAQSARSMIVSADSLQLKALKADTNLVATALTYSLGISAELKGLLGEMKIEGKRKSFQIVSDQLYDLVRTVQYDREVVYLDYCPMAFNDQGANWLSNTATIRNPYIPAKMISCGEIKDSIDFRKR